MKTKSVILFFFVCLLAAPAFSQTLVFAEKVDASGKAVNQNVMFAVGKSGGQVTFLFTLPSAANLPSVNFDLYKLEGGKEVYQSTMKQAVNANQKWVSKQVTFYNEGRYRVYVFDDADKQLAKAELTVKKAN